MGRRTTRSCGSTLSTKRGGASQGTCSWKPIGSFHSLDRSGSVIYVGTFTKMLFNALRIGFIVVPERLVEVFRVARSFIDRHAPTLDQGILTEFINEGHFGHHVRKMRQVYSDRS